MVELRKFPRFKIAYSSTKTQKWGTAIQTSGSGKVRTLTNRIYPQWLISCKIPALTNKEQNELLGFVALGRGAFTPFLWWDHEHHHEDKAQLLMIAPGIYQAVMRIGGYAQPVSYIEKVTVFIDGQKQTKNAYTVSNGRIRFSASPSGGAVVTATYDYWWKVMLQSDSIAVEQLNANLAKTQTIKLVSVE